MPNVNYSSLIETVLQVGFENYRHTIKAFRFQGYYNWALDALNGSAASAYWKGFLMAYIYIAGSF